MVAALRRLPLPPPRDEAALPPLSSEQQSLFRWAIEQQGIGEYTKLTDPSNFKFQEAEWIELRAAYWIWRTAEPEQFSWDSFVTPSKILQYVEECERSHS
jgi:hypothetical protein